MHSVQQSCQHDSHGARIGRAVCMAPNHTVHGTGVQAGPAPNALKHFAVFPGDYFGSAVVQQNNVHLLRPGGFARFSGPGNHRHVSG